MTCPQCKHGILNAHGCQRCGWRTDTPVASPSIEMPPLAIEAPKPEADLDVSTLLDQAPPLETQQSTLAEE